MSLFISYILGACIAGLLFSILTYNSSFYEFICKAINDAKNEMIQSDKYSEQEKVSIKYIDTNVLVNALNTTCVLFSWVGVVCMVIFVFSWILEK